MEANLKELEDITPQLSIKIFDENGDTLGYLIIDSIINNGSCGGVRMHANVTEEEIRGLARAMTYKYGFLGFPKGGAKSGIIADSTLPLEKNINKLEQFGRSLAPLITHKIYMPGEDLGTNEQALKVVWKVAGLEYESSGSDMSGLHTSYTVCASAVAAMKFQEIDVSKARIAIEGFGSVGSHTAKNLSEKGAKIVAISTVQGAIFNERGFDVEKLMAGRKSYGDAVVNHIPDSEKISLEELLELELDVLIPCAKAYTIHSQNVNRIKSKIVCPGANIPVTGDAEKILSEKSIAYIPDFVANSGGVLCSTMRFLGLSEKETQKLIEEIFDRKINILFKQAVDGKMTMADFARYHAIERFEKRKKMYQQQTKGQFRSLVAGLLRKMPFAKVVTKRYAPQYFEKMILRD